MNFNDLNGLKFPKQGLLDGFWRIKGWWNICRSRASFSGLLFVPVFEPQQLCENKVAVARARVCPPPPFSSHRRFIFAKVLWLENRSFFQAKSFAELLWLENWTFF